MQTRQAGPRRSVFFPQKRTLCYMLFGTAAVLLIGLWLTFSTQSALPPASSRVIAGGDPSPLGGVFATSGTPALGLGNPGANGTEVMAFFAAVDGGSAPLGIFLAAGTNLMTVVAVGEPTPVGGTFSWVSLPVQNQAGQVAFAATLADTDSNVSQGLFLASGGHIVKIAAVGGQTPLGEISAFPSPPALNNLGEVAFGAAMKGEPAGQGIFLATGGTVRAVVVHSDLTPLGGHFSFPAASCLPVALNDAGTLAFTALLADGSAPQGIFLVSRSGSITNVVAAGEPTPVGGTFASFTPPVLNNAGEVAFGATIAEGAVSQGVFLVSQGQLIPVVADGGLAPKGGTFAVAVGLSPPPALNDRGEVAFSARLVGVAQDPLGGIFLFSGGQLRQVMVDSEPTLPAPLSAARAI